MMWNMLVVDDEPIVRMGLRWMADWERLGVRWKGEASNAEEALQLIEAEEIHIVLTDIRMPGLSGLELAKRLLGAKPGLQVVILSSYDDFAYAKEALRIGVADYLHKPTMDENELQEALQKVISRLEHRQASEQPASLTDEERNEYLLSLLDKYTYPDKLKSAEFGLDRLAGGFRIVLFRRREDAVPAGGDDRLRFQSLRYLIQEYVTKEWGGIVFSRDCREVIWLANESASRQDMGTLLDALRQNVLSLLNMALVSAASGPYRDLRDVPDAYLDALLQLPVNVQSDNYLVRKAKEYVDRHLLEEEITLGRVAGELGVSSGYLSRVFIMELGENFSDYVIRNKLEYAQRLLRQTNLKVYEISDRLGYTNPQYFSKLFKERVGVTPLEYRNQ